MSSAELDALIVEHLADLDQAAVRITGIEDAIFASMNKIALEWANQHGWKGKFDYSQGAGWLGWTNAWLASSDWRTPGTSTEDDDFDGSFDLNTGDGDTGTGKVGEDRHYLTRLCGVSRGQIGFVFERPSFVKVRAWKLAIPRIREIVSHPSFIVITKAELAAFFLPVKVDHAALAAALREEDISMALAPFKAALDILAEAKPQFDEVLRYLRSATA